MSNFPSRAVPVPAGRLSRATRLGTMALGVAGNVALRGAAQLGRGVRPTVQELLLTPANLHRITRELARMRGAAMKLGQLLSMDSSELLPPEMAEIMARLRGDADFMPPAQLKSVLTDAWGPDWLRRFKSFGVRPIAAASIGQVHRAVLRDGRDIAVKVQYPGISRSIDSDVTNVGTLLKMSGLLPRGFELDPYLTEARAQLHEETDYRAEATHLKRFDGLLAGDPRFALPEVVDDLTTNRVLTMTFQSGMPIEAASDLAQAERDRIMHNLLDLVLCELFTFGFMQTDPNFANYRYDAATGRIALLDFGAARVIGPTLAEQYRSLMRAGLTHDRAALSQGIRTLGLINEDTAQAHAHAIFGMVTEVFNTVTGREFYDFADTALSDDLQRRSMALAADGFVPPPLPIDILFVQRKFAGTFLLAARLKARVNVRGLLDEHLQPSTTASTRPHPHPAPRPSQPRRRSAPSSRKVPGI